MAAVGCLPWVPEGFFFPVSFKRRSHDNEPQRGVVRRHRAFALSSLLAKKENPLAPRVLDAVTHTNKSKKPKHLEAVRH